MTEFIGRLLTAIGILWIALSGLCSAVFLGTLLFESASIQDLWGTLPMVLLVGGFSAGIGFVVMAIGKSIRPLK